jgi:hypothetical protein
MKDYNESIPDEIVSKDFWDAMCNREQSPIIELFHGQYKSKVSCVECGGSSVKADAFASLSLDIPPVKEDFVVRVVRMGGGSVEADRLEVKISLAVHVSLQFVERELNKMFGFEQDGDSYIRAYWFDDCSIVFNDFDDGLRFCRVRENVIL